MATLTERGRKGERGVATILIAGVIAFFLIFFLVVAIDFAYIYVARGELQNAADAAALAGAALLSAPPSDLVQTDARDEAIEFAAKNFAAGASVVVVTDGANALGDNNDITVGHWSGTAYTRGATPVNAIEVRPQRRKGLEGSGRGPVGLLFGGIVGWPVMEVSRVAVATRPPTPTSATALCIEACDLVVPPGGLFMAFKEKSPPRPDPEKTVAFTEFSCDKATEFGPSSTIARLIRQEIDVPNVCDQCITTNNAAPQQIMSILRDAYNLNKDANGNWSVIIPVVNGVAAVPGRTCPNCAKVSRPNIEACPTGDQPDEPFWVERYGVMVINGVTLNPNPGIHIADLDCTPCPALELLGRRARLVR